MWLHYASDVSMMWRLIVCRYFQYDSWFYMKDITMKHGGGVLTWDAMSSVFPHGMQYVSFVVFVHSLVIHWNMR